MYKIDKIDYNFDQHKMMRREEFSDLKDPVALEEYAKGIIRKHDSVQEVDGLREGEQCLHWDEHGEWPEDQKNNTAHFLNGSGWAWCTVHCSIMKGNYVVADKVIGFS